MSGTANAGSAEAALASLTNVLEDCGSAVVALSGGVDSATLAHHAFRVLGARSLAVTGVSPSLSSYQRGLVEAVLNESPMPHEWIDTNEIEDASYRRNGADRCFFCKDELYGTLRRLARSRGFATVLDGTNRDDLGDHRPGRRAASVHGVRSPFLEAGLGKEEIRALAREAGLPVAEEPASACLASRVERLVPITAGALGRVEAGEAAVRNLGFSAFRVRDDGEMARIELAPDDIRLALAPEMRRRLAAGLRAAGYPRAAVDLRGYRPAGSARPPDPEKDLVFLASQELRTGQPAPG